jgi:DNA-binding transcriptional regulator YiaG
MRKKVIDRYVYEGLGFPVILINIAMKEAFGEWILDMDLNHLQQMVLRALIHKPVPLNGHELRFIRKYFEMTIVAFGKLLGVTHAAVLKWENNQSHINPATETYIRLFVMDRLQTKDREFRKFYHEICIEELAKYRKVGLTTAPIEIDTKLGC